MNQYNLPTQHEIETALGLDPVSKRSSSLKRYAIFGILGLATAALAFWYYTAQTAPQSVSYVTQAVAKTNLIITVTATGTVQPTTQLDVGSEVSGTVRQVNVQDNSIVKKGDVLATLDDVRISAQRARAAAQLSSAKARLQEAEANSLQAELSFKRQAALNKSGFSTTQDFETARTTKIKNDAAVAIANADIESAKADLAIVDIDLTKTQILSPINGIVLKTSVKPGQTVAASLQAPVLFTLAENLDHIQIEAAVDEADIGQLKIGQPVKFNVDAYPNRDFTAQVSSMSNAPDKTDGVVTYKSILLANNNEMALRPGMTSTARITINEIENTLAVPNEALRYAPPKIEKAQGFSITQIFMPRFPRGTKPEKAKTTDGTRSIYVLRNNAPVELKIKSGASDSILTAITNGDLKEGDLVILSSSTAAK